MKIKAPGCTVINRTTWKGKRNDEGGEKGLAKVALGPALDTFHTAVGKAGGDSDLLRAAISALDKVVKSYVEEVKPKNKDNKYTALLALVKTEIQDKLEAYSKAVTEAVNKATEAQKVAEQNYKSLLQSYANAVKELEPKITGLHASCQLIYEAMKNNKYEQHVNDYAPTVKKIQLGLADYDNRIDAFKKVAEQRVELGKATVDEDSGKWPFLDKSEYVTTLTKADQKLAEFRECIPKLKTFKEHLFSKKKVEEKK